MEHRKVQFKVEEIEKNVVARLLSPTLGVAELECFGGQLADIVEKHSGKNLVLDLTQVRQLSSTVIGRIFRIRKMVLTSGARFIIVANQPAVKHVFELCHLYQIVEIHEKLEDALK